LWLARKQQGNQDGTTHRRQYVTLANEITEKKDQSQGKGSGGFQLPGDPEATNNWRE
jgi:hypothetical protein